MDCLSAIRQVNCEYIRKIGSEFDVDSINFLLLFTDLSELDFIFYICNIILISANHSKFAYELTMLTLYGLIDLVVFCIETRDLLAARESNVC